MISLFSKENLRLKKGNSSGVLDFSFRFNDQVSRCYLAEQGGFKIGYKSAFPRSMVTIAMSLRFSEKSCDIEARYFKVLAKLASLLKENSQLVAVLEPCAINAISFTSVELVRLRLRNVMDYLVNNFGISYSRFYMDKLISQNSSLCNIETAKESYDGVTITLKYPKLFS